MNLIVILGQTSSGKSDLAIDWATRIPRSCIVNCDSRQVYKGLNKGTGKVEGDWQNGIFVSGGVDHYLIDYVDPAKAYNVVDWILDFNDLMRRIENQYDTIILVGGTGLYAKAIVEQVDYGFIKPEFESQYLDYKTFLQNKLLLELQDSVGIDSGLNNSDWNNPTRLVSFLLRQKSIEEKWLSVIDYYNFSSIKQYVIDIDQQVLSLKIQNRLMNRLQQGIVEETKSFLYLGRDRLWQLGLEYRLSWLYLHGLMTEQEFHTKLFQQNWQYCRRQLSWLKKQPNLEWIKV